MSEYARQRAAARKPPEPAEKPRPRKGMRKVSKKRAALMKTLSPERRELKERVGCCMKCRQPNTPEYLDPHEIANGAAREACLSEPLLVMVLCRSCHDEVQGWKPARQIALHFRWFIECACKRFCELKGLAETAVTSHDVVNYLMYQRNKRMKVKKRGSTKRYEEIINHYRKSVGHAFTMDEVTQWILDNKLFPVPSIRNTAEEGAEWDARFSELTEDARG